MNNTYHPEHDQLLEFSAGSIDPSLGLCISVHLESCEQCRQQLSKMDVLGGHMLQSLTPQAVDDRLFDSIMDKIEQTEYSCAGSFAVNNTPNNLPKSINKLINHDLNSLNWRKHGSNIATAKLINDKGLKASLIRIKAGATIPMHGHRGNEFTVILDGSFSDKDGVYIKGDFLKRIPGEEHSPTATTDKDCICLAVLEAPIKFNNHFYEIFNRIANQL